jgi:hypothetical protein
LPSSSSFGKIFSAVPFASVEDDEDNDENVPRDVPVSVQEALGTIFYLLEDTLVGLSGSIEVDVPLTITDIEK